MSLLRRRPAPPLRRLDSRVSRRGLLGAGVLAGVLAASGVPLQARTRGGTLRLGLARPLPFDGDWTHAPAILAQGAVYDALTEIGPTGDLSGELAQSWEAAPGAKVWHLALRRDAPFHDGTPLTSQDVLASLARHRTGPASWVLNRIERIEAQGPHALLIQLHDGDPDFPFLLADPRLVIGPEGTFDGTGTGLYRLAEHQPPGRLRLDRVAEHWKDGRAGWFDAVEAVPLPDPRDRLDALLAGEVDVVDPLPPDLLAQAEGLAAAAAQGNRQLHARLPEGADASLASLLSRALDRDAIASAWAGTPAADHPLGPLHPALAALPVPAFDPEAAALVPAPLLTAWEGRPTEDATFAHALAGPWSSLRDHPALLPHLAAARATEGPERQAHYEAAQAICAEAAVVAVVAHIPAVTLHSPALAHGPVSGAAPLDGARLPERWWFA
ncbi:ABC transporter, substrate-binding protein [Rubellimicrobium mesophilum DSM 19309]|uniref:ABC transporter, substrate-binding protein n=1 Tax=Rubellimicrobium mesophilum DSM 19309 TaxID=442562 RepID=A0A017HMG0_9RHOB|nr:ABC transporter substrate-binding protein [Rubellimicrobium mesophilum]EYD75358.1 ABC transporter, substrate-binding protein [Rubellimicrobium mesophilum DSM 19309]